MENELPSVEDSFLNRSRKRRPTDGDIIENKVKAERQTVDLKERPKSVQTDSVRVKMGEQPDMLENNGRRSRSPTKVVASKGAKFLDHMMQARGNHACKKIYRSKASIEKENDRQREMNRFIIHPFSAFRWYWDMVMVATLMITLLVLPVEVAFFSNFSSTGEDVDAGGGQKHDWMAINAVVDTLFLLDLFLNFRTAYVHPATEEVIFDNKKIALNYVKTWFALDFVSSVPWDYLYNLMFASDENASDDSVVLTLRVLKLAKLLSLLRILRVARLLRYVNQLEEFMKIEGTVISIFHLIMVTIIFCHWNACIQYLVAFIEGFPPNSWVVKFDIHGNVSTWEKYSFSMYRSIAHMLGMGYGLHAPPTTLVELWIGMVCYIFGGTFYALFIAHISNMIMSMNLAGKKYEQKFSNVTIFTKYSWSIYRSLAHIMGTGFFLQTKPTTLWELWIAKVSYAFGISIYASYIGKVIEYVNAVTAANMYRAKRNTTFFVKYTFSVFRSLAQMLSTGYIAQGVTTTQVERWLVIVSFTVGRTFFALYIAQLKTYLASLDRAGKDFEKKVAEVREYMRFRKVPTQLQFRVLDFYDHMYQRKFFDERGILFEPNMSPILREEILLHNCRNLVMKVKFLADAPKEALSDLIQRMHFQVFFPGDHIIQAGRRGDCMYFIEHGLAEVRLLSGQVVKELKDGDHFGEIALVMDQRRTACIVAVEICDVYLLLKQDLENVLQDHPSLKTILESEAKRRLAEDTFSQEQTSQMFCSCVSEVKLVSPAIMFHNKIAPMSVVKTTDKSKHDKKGKTTILTAHR